MSYHADDTIAAIATAAGGAARGIVRVSGPATLTVVEKCFLRDDDQSVDCSPRAVASIGYVEVRLDRGARQWLPCDLFLWPTDRSYTRQPVAEFHTLGSPPLLRAVLDAVCHAGARLAEPGEFTLRAFLAGRLDLVQAEAVLGVIDARQDAEFAAALRQLAGGLAAPLHRLRDDLVDLLAELEAGLDFVEEDIEFITADELGERLRAAAAVIGDVAAQMTSRLAAEILPQIVLVGPPNAGKSSLFNALAARCREMNETKRPLVPAIISPQHGTTRDYLTQPLELGGVRCELVDTAGIEPPANGIGATAQELSSERRQQAFMRVHCVDATAKDVAEQCAHARSSLPAEIVALTKADLAPQRTQTLAGGADGGSIVATSSVTGAGLDALAEMLAATLAGAAGDRVTGCVAVTADRCRESLRLADAAIARAREVAAEHGGEELIAAELRGALTEVGKIVGTVYTDDILDRIFKTFCIGK